MPREKECLVHCTVLVAIPGTVASDDVPSYLFTAMDAHAEQDGAEWPGLEAWDWWVIGGRRPGMFTLTADANSRRRAGTLELPIDTDLHLGGFPDRQLHYYDTIDRIRSVFPIVVDNPREPLLANQTDCARLRDIEPESIAVPFYWLQEDGQLYDMYFDPDYVPVTDVSEFRRVCESGTPLRDYDRLEEVNSRRFREWLETLPADTWLVNISAHR